MWLRDDVTGQVHHFPDAEYDPISGAVLNDDEGNTARQLLAMLEVAGAHVQVERLAIFTA